LCSVNAIRHVIYYARSHDRLSENRRVMIIIINCEMSYWNKILHELCAQFNIVIIHTAVAILLLRGAHYTIHTESAVHNGAQIVHTRKLLYNYYNIRALHSRYTTFPLLFWRSYIIMHFRFKLQSALNLIFCGLN